MDTKLPEPIEPEYKSWSLEKLQNEYFRQGLQLTSAKLALLDYEKTEKVIANFVEALKEVTEIYSD